MHPTRSAIPTPGTKSHSVLVEPGVTIVPDVSAPSAYTLRGSTTNLDISYDSSLGTNGHALADAMLASCESDLAKLEGFFGIASPGRYSVFIDPGTFGAFHFGCLDETFTALRSAARMAIWRIF